MPSPDMETCTLTLGNRNEQRSSKNSLSSGDHGGADNDDEQQIASSTTHTTTTTNNTSKETRAVRALRSFLLLVMVLSALAVALAVFFYIKDSEETEFEREFDLDAAKVLAALGTSLDRTLANADSFVLNVLSHARDTNQTWPFVTIPNFAVRAGKVRSMTSAVYMNLYPLVREDQREEWETYTSEHNQWVQESLDIQARQKSYTGPKEADEEYENWDVIHGYDEFDKENPGVEGTDRRGAYLPFWQSAPIVAVDPVYNWDLLSQSYWDEINAVFKYHTVVFSGAYMIAEPDDYELIQENEDEAEWIKDFLPPGEEPLEPITDIYYPLLDSALDSHNLFQDTNYAAAPNNETLKGLFSLSFYWRDMLRNILPFGSDGVVLVFESDCNPTFTYEINGPLVEFLGVGDRHDSEYNRFEIASNVLDLRKFAVKDSCYSGIPVNDDFCPFHVRAYPSDKKRDSHTSRDSAIFAISSVFIFAFMTVIFLAYDCLVEKRQLRVMNAAIQSATELQEARAESEKAALIIRHAKEVAQNERDLNDYIAHEVRNPVAAALSACSFVSSALQDPLQTKESQKLVQEDVEVVHSSLTFVNDLLRSMLDVHRAENKQLKVEMAPTDLRHDVLQPVAAMLYNRNECFEVVIEGPDHLVVSTDRIRLKQIVLNLANNSRKFVRKGFIRLRADVMNGLVRLHVEDSGPGIPIDKRCRSKLFVKFQSSLDVLSQGTGVGLCLCDKLTGLLGGELTLDEEYHSGVEGCPGAGFVIDLRTPPIQGIEQESATGVKDDDDDDDDNNNDNNHETSHSSLSLVHDVALSPRRTKTAVPDSNLEEDESSAAHDDLSTSEGRLLPETLRVLFVDDDMILRKLFSRSVKRIYPHWVVREASSGEVALQMVQQQQQQQEETEEELISFDLIFIDQYMSSITKQLLGTETVRALRSRGVEACLCGLSANDVEKSFLEAGADAFMMKPFPCTAELLGKELYRVFSAGRKRGMMKEQEATAGGGTL